MSSKYLSYTDLTGETATAVLMVIIINGYVALNNLTSGFIFIVAVNIGACATWGLIDGLIYAISSSIERNNIRNKLLLLKRYTKSPDALDKVTKSLDDTFLESFDQKGKETIAKEIIINVPNASLDENLVITKNEFRGLLSIIGIYLVVGFLLALPFLIFPDKFLAWFVSNAFGVAWVFWYGVQLGKSAGKHRWILGLVMVIVSILFLVSSYLVWAR